MKRKAELMDRLQSLIGAEVRRASFVIWPSRQVDELDTRLHLELQSDTQRHSVTIRTSADGQTPAIECDTWTPDFPISELALRKRVWGDNAFWISRDYFSPEVFDLSGSGDYGDLIGVTVERAYVICFADDPRSCIGIRLDCSGAHTIYSLACAYGNCTCKELPSADALGGEVVLCEVGRKS